LKLPVGPIPGVIGNSSMRSIEEGVHGRKTATGLPKSLWKKEAED